jgi:fatty-acyl-CoA synthase
VLSRRELVSRAAAAAARLRARGIGAGDVVALIVSEHACQPVLFLGCMLAGAVPAFLAPPTPKLEPARYAAMIEALLARASSRVAIVSPQWAERLSEIDERTAILLCDDIAAPSSARVVLDEPAEIAFLQHSSGTTGLQKAVAVSHRALEAQCRRLLAVLRIDAHDAAASWLPLYHDMGLVACFLLPLYCGVPVTQIPTFDWLRDPRLLFDAVTRDRATFLYAPNFAFHHLAAQPVGDDVRLDTLRAVVNCSEPITSASFELLLRAYGARGLREDAMASSYAMAENVFAVTHSEAGVPPRRLRGVVSSGRPIEGTSVAVVDGELVISGDCVVNVAPHATGDLGFIEDGEVFVTGRKSDLLIVHGRNIHPGEIETAAQIAGVHPGRVVAVGVHSPRAGTERVVVIAERDQRTLSGGAALEAQIRAAIAASVDVPLDTVVLVPHGWIVKSTSGKASRRACREKAIAEERILID